MTDVNCPWCQMSLVDDGSLAGQDVTCPRCRRRFMMPDQSPQMPQIQTGGYSTAPVTNIRVGSNSAFKAGFHGTLGFFSAWFLVTTVIPLLVLIVGCSGLLVVGAIGNATAKKQPPPKVKIVRQVRESTE
jgi:hypothetical protein